MGWAKCRPGQADTGFTHIQEGFTAYDAMKIGLFRPLMVIAQGQAYFDAGRGGEIIETVRASLPAQEKGGELWLNAMTFTLLGDLLNAEPDSDPDAARQAWQQALDVARSQGSAPLIAAAESRI